MTYGIATVVERCFCSRCSPTQGAVQCSGCGQEVRWGTRDGQTTWHHREAVDHDAVLGHRVTIESADRARALRASLEAGKAPAASDDEEPTIEVDDADRIACHAVEVDDLPARSGMRQIANLVLKTDGWELRRLTAARGPYMGAKGLPLSISDTVVLGAQTRQVDGSYVIAVASWRDGKFDFAMTGIVEGNRLIGTDRVSSVNLKAWIKEHAT